MHLMHSEYVGLGAPGTGSDQLHGEPARFHSGPTGSVRRRGAARDEVDGRRVFDLSFALTPEEHKHETDRHRAEEREESHGGSNDESFSIKRVRT